MDEGRAHPSQQEDTASERTAVDKGGNEPLLHSDQAEVEEPPLQPSPSSPSVAGGPSCAATGKGSDPTQVEGDRPAVPAPSLLEGMVFYIADYNQSMETTIIQKWKQVCVHRVSVYTSVYMSVYMSVWKQVCVHRVSVYTSVYMSVYTSVYMYVYMSVYTSVYCTNLTVVHEANSNTPCAMLWQDCVQWSPSMYVRITHNSQLCEISASLNQPAPTT